MVRFAYAIALPLALAGCPTVDLGESPPAPGLCRPDLGYYREVIWPQVIANPAPDKSCIAEGGCHQQANGRSALRLLTLEPLSDVDQQRNYEVVTRFLNCGSPDASSFLTKPLSSIDPHGGGDILAPADPEVEAFRGWFP